MSVLFMSFFVLVLVLVFHVFQKENTKTTTLSTFFFTFLFIVSHVFHLQKRTINNKKKNEAI